MQWCMLGADQIRRALRGSSTELLAARHERLPGGGDLLGPAQRQRVGDAQMVAKRATVRDMRRSNRAVLLTKIYLDGPLSRHELTQLTALSPASVSTLVAEFLDEGLVEEAGSVES